MNYVIYKKRFLLRNDIFINNKPIQRYMPLGERKRDRTLLLEPAVIKILLALSEDVEEKQIYVSKLNKRTSSNYATTVKWLDEMERKKIVDIVPNADQPNRNKVGLTKKGERVAHKLRELMDDIDSQ